MNLKKLLFMLTFFVLIGTTAFAQVRYLNSTDGRDDNDGLTSITAYRTLTAALADFPTGSTVHMAAGNYNYNETVRNVNGNDAAGYNLTGVYAGKNMTFIVETYSGNDVAYLNGNGGFNLDIGAGKVLTFTAGDVTKNALVFKPAAGTESFTLTSGTLDVSGLKSFTIGSNVGTNAGGDAINRANGLITGTVTYEAATRDMKFLVAGTTSINTGTLVPPTLNNLDVASTAGTITIPNNLTFNVTAVNGITATAGGVASVVFSGVVTLTDGTAAGAAVVPRIVNSVAATWTFSGGLNISTTTSDGGTGVGTVLNSSTGKILITGAVNISQIDVTAYVGGVTDGNHATFFVNSGLTPGTLTVSGGVSVTSTTAAAPFVAYTAKRTPFLNVENTNTGTFNLGGATATTIGGVLTTGAAVGIVSLGGDVTLVGILTNGAGHTIKLNSSTLFLTGAGLTHANGGNITSTAIGSGLLNFASTAGGLVTWNGAGSVPNMQSGSQAVTLSAATNVNGNVTANGAGVLTLTAVTNVTGAVTLNSSGNVTFSSALATTISKDVTLAAASTGTFTYGGALNIGGAVNLSGGTFLMGAAATVSGNFNQNGGTLTFGANTLTLKKDFYRTVGTVNAGTGTLAFTLGGTQILQGGTNFLINNLSVTGLGTGVTINNGSVQVTGNCTIGSNASVTLDVYNLRFVALGSSMANAGAYYAANGGRVIFEGPDDGGGIGVAGTVHTITGTGSFGDTEVAVADEADYVSIGAGETITFAGVLILRQGTIQIPATGTLNPILAGTAKIRRNLGNLGVGTVDGRSFVIVGGGQFDANNAPYDLEYYGITTANQTVGNEFYVGVAGTLVRNLTITATDGVIDNAKLVQFPLNGAGDYKYSGTLSIAVLVEIDVTGASNLVSTGTTAANSVVGSIRNSGGGEFQVMGGTVTGAAFTTVAPVPTASVAIMRVISADPQSISLWNINNLIIDAANTGSVALNMTAQGSPATPGFIWNYTQNAGSVVLENSVQVEVFNSTAGGFDFANFNVWIRDLSGGAPADAFTASTTATFAATGAGATTGGFLQFRSAAANFNTQLTATSAIYVPRVDIDPLGTGAFAVTLTGNAGVSDIFNQNTANSLINLSGNIFYHNGNTWNSAGTTTNYGAAGTFTLLGPVTANFAGNVTVPNLTLNNGTNVAQLVDNIAGAGVPSLNVAALFTSTAGTLNLNTVDLVFTDAAGVSVFRYDGGTFNATTATGIAATDAGNGEFVFNNTAASTFRVDVAGLVIPNLRVANTFNVTQSTTVGQDFSWTVSKRLVIANTGDLKEGANGQLVLGDGCWLERRDNAGILDKVPGFTNNVDVAYAGAASITVANEAPASTTTLLRGLYVMQTGGDVVASKNLTVTTMLYLVSGGYDFEFVAGTIWTITMGSGSTVNVQDGTLKNSGSVAVTQLAGGPVTLIYSNTAARTITSREYPTSAGYVTTLNVNSTAANGTTGSLTLDINRSCGDFVLATGTATPLVANLIFNLNGLTLTVTNTSSSTLTRGVLSSLNEATDIYAYATLASAGPVSSTANASVSNTNITALSLNLAGPFGKTDFDLDAAANNTLPAGFPSAISSGTSTVAAFAGNLTSTGDVTINGAHSNGTITATANVTVGATGSMAASSNLAFVGTANTTLTVPTGGAAIGAMTLGKTNNTNTVTLAGGNLTLGNTLTFVNGLFITGANRLNIFVPTVIAVSAGAASQGFTRAGVTGTNISHVVGNVGKTLIYTGAVATSSEPRSEFPVGTSTLYKPAAITFNPAFGLPTNPAATLIVSSFDGNPGGAVGLPIIDGVATGIDVARYPNFYWTISTLPFSIGPTTPFDLELSAAGFTDYDAVANVRIIRRYGAVSDVTNDWLLQGLNSSYDNSLNGTTPTIIQRGANAGLRVGGAVFTLGIRSNMSVLTQIPKQYLVQGDAGTDYLLTNVFQGNIGALSYLAQSSNTNVATVSITGSTLKVTPVVIGDCIVTITAIDAANNDFFAYSFAVNVGLTDVAEDAIPTEFSLSQNFPNPFNPTTNIKFGLPKESNVTLRIYNILGQEVATLINNVMSAGFHTVDFNATKLSSGMYIYRIEAGDFVQVRKMLLMK